MPRLRNTLAVALTLLPLVAGGCSPRAASQQQAPQPVDWNLSDEGQTIYNYLVLEQASRSSDIGAALNAIEGLVRLSPTPRIFSDAGSFLLERRETSIARALLEKGVGLYPEDLSLHLLLLETYLAENRPGEALRLLRGFVAAHPGKQEAQQELALLLVKTRHFAEADKLVSGIPDKLRSPLLRFYHARALIGLQKLQEATAQLRKTVKASPDFLEAWAELAYVHELRKDYVEAEKLYEQILELDEGNQDVWLRLVSINLKLNNPAKAYELARQGPDTFGFLLTAATLFLDDKFYEQAEALLDTVKDTPGAPEEVYFYLAVLAFEGKKDTQETLRWLGEIKPGNKFYDRSLRLRAQLHYESGELEKALDLLRQGQEAFSNQKDFWEFEVQLHMAAGDPAQALATADRALVRWPMDPQLLFMKAMIHDETGDKEAAFTTNESVIALDPNHAQALNYVGYTLAEKGEQLPRAIALLKRAVDAMPDNAFILDSLAWAYYRAGDNANAWLVIARSVSLGAKDPTIWEHYGDIAVAVGKKAEARKGYRKALEMQPANPGAIRAKLSRL